MKAGRARFICQLPGGRKKVGASGVASCKMLPSGMSTELSISIPNTMRMAPKTIQTHRLLRLMCVSPTFSIINSTRFENKTLEERQSSPTGKGKR